MKCESCKQGILEGQIYSARTHSREVMRGGAIDVLHDEYTQVLCSDCSTFRGCNEEPAEPEGAARRSFGKELEGRDRVIRMLLRTASELQKGDDGLIRGVAMVVAGAEGAMLDAGPMILVHVLRKHEPVPEDLRAGIAALPTEIELLDVKGEA